MVGLRAHEKDGRTGMHALMIRFCVGQRSAIAIRTHAQYITL